MILLASCSKENMSEKSHSASVRFEVYDGGFEGLSRTSDTQSKANLDVLKYYFVRNGHLVEGLNTESGGSQILVDGLQPGEYTLLVLGVKGDIKTDGAIIHTLETPSDVWLEFSEETAANHLNADYYYASYKFNVEEGVEFDGRIPLKHIAGKIDFEMNYASQYTEASTKDVIVSIPQARFYKMFKADNTFDGLTSSGLEELSIKDVQEFMFMPMENGSIVEGTVRMIAQDHRGENTENVLEFEKQGTASNRNDRVSLFLANKDKDNGMVYLSERSLEKKGFARILQDNESKSVYYDANQRSFYIHQPVQVKVTEDGKLNLKYYCARPMKGVTVYAKFNGTGNEYIELAYIDELPDFADLTYNLDAIDRECIFRTESGRYLSLMLPQDLHEQAELKLTSSDGLMDKFNKIPARWKITFWNYGADPDREDGGQVGNWIGIRPVHIRSAICILQNVAYMLSFRELHERVRHTEFNLKDDHNVPIEGDDRYQILKKMVDMTRLNLGLVHPPEGSSSRGLGGGGTMGIDQEGWIGCYWYSGIRSRNLPVILHELGHNMGYSGHAGCMTDYGPEAYVSQDIFPEFFWEKWSSGDIIIDKDYVNASSSPFLYRFK